MYVTMFRTLCYGEQITLYCMPKMMQCTVTCRYDWQRVSHAARKGHSPYYIVIGGLSGFTTFFHIIS